MVPSRSSTDVVVPMTRARASAHRASRPPSVGVAVRRHRRGPRARASTTDDVDDDAESASVSRRDAVDACASRAAWRGHVPTQSTLPLNSDGTVNYASIDANPISKVLTRTIRGLLVDEVGGDDGDPTPWTEFPGIMTAVREVNDMKGDARDVQVRAKRVFAGILPALKIGWIPPIWKKVVAPRAPEWMANYAFVLVFTNLFPWLMGPMEGVDHVEVPTPEWLRKTFANAPKFIKVPQAVKAERCRFLETSQCASVCVNTCKAPSQEWLKEDFGMDLHIQPNYDDFSCQWKFNTPPPPLYEDAAVMVPCFAKCDSEYKGEKDAFRQRVRVQTGVGIVDGVDTYTGETLEQIAARASEEAKRDASRGAYADGTAADASAFAARADDVKSGGKCWSVDERRDAMSDVRAS
jgi:hypothetical protein